MRPLNIVQDKPAPVIQLYRVMSADQELIMVAPIETLRTVYRLHDIVIKPTITSRRDIVKTYIGTITPDGDFGDVFVEENGKRRKLRLRLDLANHSPTGFAWGYGGSGPAQLSLAILADLLGDEQAIELHQRFKFAVIGALSQRLPWSLTEAQAREAASRSPGL